MKTTNLTEMARSAHTRVSVASWTCMVVAGILILLLFSIRPESSELTALMIITIIMLLSVTLFLAVTGIDYKTRKLKRAFNGFPIVIHQGTGDELGINEDWSVITVDGADWLIYNPGTQEHLTNPSQTYTHQDGRSLQIHDFNKRLNARIYINELKEAGEFDPDNEAHRGLLKIINQ